MEWRNIYRGMIMGIIELVPGISSGTFAVLLGIYERLIAAISGITTRQWKKHILFLIPLVIGMGISIFSFSHLMDWLLENHAKPTFYFFMGLILGILPFLFRTSKARTTFKFRHIVLLIVGILLVNQLQIIPSDETIIVERNFTIYMLLFFSGIIGSAMMLLPGISGSFVLVVLGVYHTIISAIKELEILVIFVVGSGIALGVLVMSKIIDYFFARFRSETFAFVIGLVIGSVFVIFPGWFYTASQFIIYTGLFVLGIGLAYIFGKIEY